MYMWLTTLYFHFDVHILQQDVMYKDIFLTMLDIPYSLPFLIELCIILGKGTKLQKETLWNYLWVYNWLNCTDCVWLFIAGLNDTKCFKVNYNVIAIYTASQPVGFVEQLLSVYGLNIFLLLHMSYGWLQNCTSGRSINVATEQTGGMTDLRFTQRSQWTVLWQQFGSDFTAHCCVVTERYSNKLVTVA